MSWSPGVRAFLQAGPRAIANKFAKREVSIKLGQASAKTVMSTV